MFTQTKEFKLINKLYAEGHMKVNAMLEVKKMFKHMLINETKLVGAIKMHSTHCHEYECSVKGMVKEMAVENGD